MIVVDGPFLAFRAFSVGGVDAMIGATLRTILKLRHDHGDEVAVVWELPSGMGMDLRRNIYPDYKSRRSTKPTEFADTLRWLQEQLHTAFGILQVWPDEGEADDAACTMSRNRTGPVVLWSADHDWFQLVEDEGVSMLRARPGAGEELLTVHNIAELTGWTATEWLDIQSLAGDTGDDIPGLPRIGMKRAGDLIRSCPEIIHLVLSGNGDTAINKVMANDASMARWAQVVVDHHELLLVTRQLVTLQEVSCSCRDGSKWDPSARPPPVNRQRAIETLQSMDANSLIDFLPREPDPWEQEEAAADPWDLGCE